MVSESTREVLAQFDTIGRNIDKLKAQRDRYRVALELIVARHPDSPAGEHPAVDIARAALS